MQTIFKNPLLDEVFLQNLYLDRHKEIYAKIIALNKNEEPVEQIEGQVTGGSVSLDGSSNVRRSCNLTIIAKNIDINSYYWGFKNKFKLYLGLSNHIDSNYEDIIWFPFGVMIITNFSTSLSTNGYNISISGKDKMCLINGELSGSLFASVDFGKEEYYDTTTKVTTISDIPIKQIIREAVHEYAGEPWENIIINDLDDYGLELLDYKGNKPLYLIIAESSGSNENLGDVIQITLDGNTKLYLNDSDDSFLPISSESIIYNPRTSLNFEQADLSEYTIGYYGEDNRVPVSIAKVEYGQTCGYRYTDITYAGDLILGVGEPITAMLDKLVAMLGNWEYFYDVDGRFVFQRKKTYLDKTWNTIVTNNDDSYIPTMGETYVESALWSSAVSWNFTDSFLVTTFNNTPVLNNVKNDYSIWGTKKSINGTELPVHLRYAIDKKPNYYKTIDGIEWATNSQSWWAKNGEGNVNKDFNQLAEMIKNESYEKIIKLRRKRLNELKFQHFDEVAKWNLPVPQRQSNGLWTPGWWDMEDWKAYYYAVKGEVPDQGLENYTTQGNTGYYNINYEDIFVNGEKYEVHYGPSRFSQVKIIDIFTLTSDINSDEIAYYIEDMHNDICGHKYTSYFLNIVQRCNEAAAHKTYLTTQDLIHSNPQMNAKYKDYIILEANSYFYNPAISQEAYADTEEMLENEIKVEINTDYTDDKIRQILAERGYYYVDRSKVNLVDWREIIFQMAKDYRKYAHYTPIQWTKQEQQEIDEAIKNITDKEERETYIANKEREKCGHTNQELLNIAENFGTCIRENNGKNIDDEWYYPSGRTGYEQYYTDLEGFWRQLYCPPQLLETWYDTGVWTDRPQGDGQQYVITLADKTEISFFVSTNWVHNGDVTKDGWNTQVIDSPATLNFWFDFLDADNDSDFAKYSVPMIGDRAKSVNDSMVKAIYFREVPNTIFTENLSTTEHKSGYTYMQYQNSMTGLFAISSQGKCAIDVMEEWLNNYVYAIESVNITTIPIYHLQPNTRIKIMDMESKINGDYIVSRISIPLVYNGTMSITATKVADRVY